MTLMLPAMSTAMPVRSIQQRPSRRAGAPPQNVRPRLVYDRRCNHAKMQAGARSETAAANETRGSEYSIASGHGWRADLGNSTTSPKSEARKLVACRDTNAACQDWADNGECTKNEGFMNSACPVACKQCSPAELNASDYVGLQLLMNTSFGGIKVRPLWENAARTAALIMDLALQPDSSKKACRFYRSEAVPPAGSDGPPYGLLQGSLAGVLKAPPAEGTSLPLY
ncbi:ShKT domain-containing protein, partial [Haematococcus lacustris]